MGFCGMVSNGSSLPTVPIVRHSGSPVRGVSWPVGLTPHHLYFFFGRFALLGISGRNRLAHNEFLSFSEPLVLAMRDQRSRFPRICFADGYIVSRQCNVRTAAEVK